MSISVAILSIAGLACWAGVSLVLTAWPVATRPSLATRLGPFVPGASPVVDDGGRPRGIDLRLLAGPLAAQLGANVAVALGVRDELDVRLRRARLDADATAFRLRQLVTALGGLAATGLLAIALQPPPLAGLAMTAIATSVAYLLPEHQLTRAVTRRQAALRAELPVVTEQLAMLLTSGYPVLGAIERLARAGDGEVAADLRRVVIRVRQGADTGQALREWAELMAVPALHRTVAVLALDRAAADLGRLVADEARATREEVHRDLLALLDARGQQVWVPVTVATLVPGVILLGIPFYAALAGFLG